MKNLRNIQEYFTFLKVGKQVARVDDECTRCFARRSKREGKN